MSEDSIAEPDAEMQSSVDDALESADGAAPAEREVDELAALRAERDEYLDTARRVQAEFENYRRRIQRDQAEASDRAVVSLVEQLLPVLDSFDLAVAQARDATEVARIVDGVGLVYKELLGALERAGLERIASDGAVFDPNEHEAVLEVEGEGGEQEPTVAETLRHGFRFKARILRPAMVKVVRTN